MIDINHDIIVATNKNFKFLVRKYASASSPNQRNIENN